MSKEKLAKLVKYLSVMQDKLTSEVPVKHKDHPVSYKNFIKNEIRMTSLKIEEMKLVLGGK